MLGVNHATISKDLRVGEKSPKPKPQAPLLHGKTDDVGENSPIPPPMISQSGMDAAKAAEKAAKKEEAAKETVARREVSRNAPPHPEGF
jgi:hypothetical protein